jgi:PAS domain S-box-containing protein
VALDVTDSAIGFLGEVGPDGLLRDVAVSGLGLDQIRDQSGQTGPLDDVATRGLFDRVVDDGQSLITNGLSEYKGIGHVASEPLDVASFLGVPLQHDGRTLGMLAVANRKHGYGREEQEDLESLAPAVVEALLRRRAEEALQESEERLRLAAEAAGFGTYDADLVDDRLYWSPQMKGILGLPSDAPEQAPGTLPGFAHPDDAEHVRHLIQAAYDPAGDGQVEDEHRIVRPDGSVRWVAVKGQVHFAGEATDRRPIRSTGIIQDVTSRKKTERELQRERELLQTIYDTIPVMLVVYDPQIAEVTFNKQFERVTGWSRQDTAAANIMDLAYPDPAYRQGVADYMASLAPGFRDIRMRTKDGRTIETSWANVRIPDGRQVGIGIDISERKQAEEALRRYAVRLAFLHQVDEAILGAESADDVAQMVVNQIPDLLSCDRASVMLFDLEAQEASILAVSTGHGTELQAGWRGPMDASWAGFLEGLQRGETQAIEDLETQTTESPFLEQLRAEGIGAQVYEPILVDGRLMGTLNVSMCETQSLSHDERHILRDLSTQVAVALEQARLREEVRQHTEELERRVRRRTEALEASEARFRTIFEEAAIGIALVTPQGGFMAANPALETMLGRSQKDLVGAPFFATLTGGADGSDGGSMATEPSDIDPGRALDELREGARQEYTLELPFVRVGGEPGAATVTVSPLRRHTAGGVPLLALVEDITERKHAQEALVRAERLTTMGRMAASLAHEVNNPLQSVVGCLGLAVEALEEGESATDLMDVALKEVKRAARIVHRMRDLSREHGGEKEPGRITGLLDRAQTVTRKRAENSQVLVIREESDYLPPISMAADRVQQVFLNLILNAIDAMPEGGELRIRARVTGEPPGVEVSFRDSGVGIPPEDLEQLFEAFHSDKEHGLGLGLYVSRNIVKDHGGRIDVRSKLGFGSTFTVWLPQAPDDHADNL